jgi:hypothetical protein
VGNETGGSGVIDQMIRQRAFEISRHADAGTPEENWQRAREELCAELEREAHEAAADPGD